MASLLQALIANESGGRNIPNTTQGTSSGQAQGYFQITTGTWDEFGGRQYAPTPLQATPAQQAAVASRIPLKRWDESTVARMRATGIPIDRNRTLGENLAMNGETFTGFARDAGTAQDAYTGEVPAAAAPPVRRHVGGAGSSTGNFTTDAPVASPGAPAPAPEYNPYADLADDLNRSDDFSGLAATLAQSVSGKGAGGLAARAAPAVDPLPSIDYASAVPEGLASATPAVAPPPGDLASLFKVATIGQAPGVDPRTGMPLRQRQYG